MLTALPLPLLIVCLGAVTGTLLGLTGAGGGVLAGPLLMLALGLSVNEAAPLALLAVLAGASLGAILGLRAGQTRYRAAVFMALAGLLATPVGITLAHHLPNRPLLAGFAGLLIYQAWRATRRPEGAGSPADSKPCEINPATGRFIWNRPCAWAFLRAGALAGLFSGLLGVGGGFLLVPALRRHTDLAMAGVSATSLAVLALISAASLAQWAALGGLATARALPFIGGTLVGMGLGRFLAPRLGDDWPQRFFALLCLLVAGGLVWRAVGG